MLTDLDVITARCSYVNGLSASSSVHLQTLWMLPEQGPPPNSPLDMLLKPCSPPRCSTGTAQEKPPQGR